MIFYFRIDATGSKEARQFLCHIIENMSAGHLNELPDVVILEDLHLATSLNDVFSPLTQLETVQENVKFPVIIGTTGPMTQSSAQLQLQFDFRLVNHHLLINLY